MADKVNDGPGPMSEAADFMAVRAIAPFEVAAIFADWARAESIANSPHIYDQPDARRLAEVWRTAGQCSLRHQPMESFEAYGERVAKAVFALLKVV